MIETRQLWQCTIFRVVARATCENNTCRSALARFTCDESILRASSSGGVNRKKNLARRRRVGSTRHNTVDSTRHSTRRNTAVDSSHLSTREEVVAPAMDRAEPIGSVVRNLLS